MLLSAALSSRVQALPLDTAQVSYPTSAAARAFLSAVAGPAGYRVTQGFGDHRSLKDPETGETVDLYGYGSAGHTGWDIALGQPGKDGTLGAVIHAPFAGTVSIGEQRSAGGVFTGLGRWVKLVAANGESVTFGHLGQFGAFHSGQRVSAGATLGYEGTSGNSTGYHVHVMVRTAGGSIVDPAGAVAGLLSPGTSAPLAAAQGKAVPVVPRAAAAVKTTPSAAATAQAEAAVQRAHAQYENARELDALGAVATRELKRLKDAVTQAETQLAQLKRGVPTPPVAQKPQKTKVQNVQTVLAQAKAAYQASMALYKLGGVSKVELQNRAKALELAQAAYQAQRLSTD
ncbi:M23 family metallopeptidase (plasmid) [Deinococcus sp. KNUC1210]|uniref:M23 family metallopeptidase n=1 Tax=Deinococcus sp. KNUC1210 TaxID=2917691 RepID=UPI001EEF7D27|nr:M23 family metallopeptidase [Deinococcus sp. KNUC1210]ULH13840.1 M23 family metallopeptidase [Deinococcus sp. KNUC1210]